MDAINILETLKSAVSFDQYRGGVFEKHVDVVGSHWSRYYKAQRMATQKGRPSSSGYRHPLPWSHLEVSVSGVSYVFDISRFDIRQVGYGNDSATFDALITTPLPLASQELEDLAVNKALSDLSNQEAGFAEDFATRKQTERMVGDNMITVAHRVTDFKQSYPKEWGKVRKLRQFGREVADAIPNGWLELQYGWVPLLLDCQGAFQMLKERDKDGDSVRKTAKGFRNQKSTSTRSGTISFPGDISGGTPVSYQVDDVVGSFVRLDYYAENPVLVALQRLGVVNPLSIAWELVPYSFVVDWFLPIGSYLQAWTADLGYQFLGGSISTFRQRQVSAVQTGTPRYASGYLAPTGGSMKAFSVVRRVLDSSPAPRRPHFKNPFTLGHFANAMSLLVSAFR